MYFIEGDNNLLSPFLIFKITTLKTKWYPKLSYNRLFNYRSNPLIFLHGAAHGNSNIIKSKVNGT